MSVSVQEMSHSAEARRMGALLAKEADFSETEAGKVAIVITEAATNLVKHGSGGELLLRHVIADGTHGIELVVLDKGSGMENVQNCMRDGYSTGGSPGTGLGAITRQSAFFDIYSVPGKGTALFIQFWAKPLRPSSQLRHIEVGGVGIPKLGEEVCGDGWAYNLFPDAVNLLITDGLGHGDSAAQATQEAIRLFEGQPQKNPVDTLRILHQGLKSTRGAAAAVIHADLATGAIRYAGIGNTTGSIVGSSGIRHMVSYNGTLGHNVRKVQEFTYEWPPESLLVLMTDGLATQWNLNEYPGLTNRHPTLIAAVLYRDFNRGRDDATVVVARRRAA